jgi:O-succinylbenzoic acid--CoA ligase
VYDGVPLDGVTLSTDVPPADGNDWAGRADRVGRVGITGPVVARGYRLQPGHPSFPRSGSGDRTFLTDDLAVVNDGRWTVVGRVDDVIITGGVKVDPAVVEAVLAGVTGVGSVIVTGIADDVWGQSVVAVVVPNTQGPPDDSALRRAVTAALGPAAAPKHVLLVESIPERGIGKPDRSAVGDLAGRAFGDRGGDT